MRNLIQSNSPYSYDLNYKFRGNLNNDWGHSGYTAVTVSAITYGADSGICWGIFNGTTSYVDPPDIKYAGKLPFTISAWVNTPALGANQSHTLFSYSNGANYCNFGITDQTTPSGSQEDFWLYGGGASNNDYRPSDARKHSLNAWNNYVIAYGGGSVSSSTIGLFVYVNGSVLTQPGSGDNRVISLDLNMRIGGTANALGFFNSFANYMGDFIFSKSMWSSTDVTTYYNANKTRYGR